ncbi:2-amino-4-hydroxy-6-hydroxymethyldihydropteridine diphosphokinase [Sphingomonas montanisoli]|uniref:2-amino-4-hydroxy-6-hydroxymethyldihydropteridine pyrophosphokinase n=1 Tax=Sphingomonas montanisoli TaxID=2606412 RepID=A0A5D9C3A5_9SPHN|nr:2-amino-4-hydroxy-6-hydroxymethyldihydropteridine diphosphokinase [Sphingomonas montanisoli]TZG26016.1 2-amino-4-hydroxy-6-hydroxymethyldihydropteridine diphosphokinase [Sphingomonas montanisoli]
MTYRYAIALGSNRRHGRHGSPAAVLRAAIAALETEGLRIVATSPILATPALGPAGRAFANAAILAETPLDPPVLLALLKRIERSFGRRPGRRWGPRVLDLDVILWSGGIFRTRRLSIPHRETAKRAFVLKPLARIAPRWHLGAGRVAHALARLDRARPRS